MMESGDDSSKLSRAAEPGYCFMCWMRSTTNAAVVPGHWDLDIWLALGG